MDLSTQDPAEVATITPPAVLSILEMSLSGPIKSLEVHADGIYDTSNQTEGKLCAASLGLEPMSPKGDPVEPAGNVASSVREPHACELESPSQSEPTSIDAQQSDTSTAQVQSDETHSADAAVVAIASDDIASPVTAASEQQLQSLGDAASRESCDSSPRADVAPVASSSSPREGKGSSSHQRTAPTTSHDEAVSEDTLREVQAFLVTKIQENQLSSHAQQIHEFVAQHMSAAQQRRELPALVQRIVEQFTLEAQERGDADVSIDAQSGICVLEQMFLSLGRVSPLQDMYTAEEEALLESLALSSARGDSARSDSGA